VIRGRVIGPEGTRSNVPLLIDTGADVSVIPLAAANAVGAIISRSTAPIQFLAGQEIVVDQSDLAIEFVRYRFRGSFLVVDSEYGVVGRNVLNALALTLDGTRLEWSIAD
jgi:predicted aspartyl protease